MVPAAHGRQNVGRSLIAHAHEGRDRAGIIFLACKDEVLAFRGQLGRILEQTGIMALHTRED